MTVGGVLAGLAVALLAGASARLTEVAEDASLAAFFIISLAAGTLLVSAFGTDEDLLHVLFGHVLELTPQAVLTIAAIATGSMAVLAIVYRALIAECFDPGFLRAAGRAGALVHAVFLSLVVLNLVGGFQALGTLMAVGLMMLPAVAARFWAETAGGQIAVAVGVTIVSAVTGLLVAFHAGTHPEASIVLVAGAFYVISLAFGPNGSLTARMIRLRHLEA
jgi:zinc/manganese transport system permease protein